MDKKGKIALITALVIVAILLVGLVLAAKPSERGAKEECRDKIDNDGDGFIDMADGGCDSRYDNDESNCGDGVCEGGETSENCVADCGQPNACSDTDGGNIINTFGATYGLLNGIGYNSTDYCVDSSNVMEYFCSGNYETSLQQSCGTDFYGSNYCNNGDVYKDLTDYTCASGACGNSVSAELVETCNYGCTDGTCDVLANSCDETDFGWDPYSLGTTYGILNETGYNSTDYCTDSTNVMEYYCDGDFMTYEILDCTLMNGTGCSNSECY